MSDDNAITAEIKTPSPGHLAMLEARDRVRRVKKLVKERLGQDVLVRDRKTGKYFYGKVAQTSYRQRSKVNIRVRCYSTFCINERFDLEDVIVDSETMQTA